VEGVDEVQASIGIQLRRHAGVFPTNQTGVCSWGNGEFKLGVAIPGSPPTQGDPRPEVVPFYAASGLHMFRPMFWVRRQIEMEFVGVGFAGGPIFVLADLSVFPSGLPEHALFLSRVVVS